MTKVTIEASALLVVDYDMQSNQHRTVCRLCGKYFIGNSDQSIEDFVDFVSGFHFTKDHGVVLAPKIPRGQASITLPVGRVVQVVELSEQRVGRCTICGERFSAYGDDPAGLFAEIVCRQHVAPQHGGVLNESTAGPDLRGDATDRPASTSRTDVPTNTDGRITDE